MQPVNTGGGRASTKDLFMPINMQMGIKGTKVPAEMPAVACLPSGRVAMASANQLLTPAPEC